VTVSSDFLAYVLDQLTQLSEITSRRMFGGAGLYSDEFFFGLISDDVLYLRVDDSNRGDYTARGMAAFRPYADRPQLSMSYYETPAEVLENAAELAAWVRRSVAVAMQGPRQSQLRRGSSARRARRRPRGRG
jgi:DNA transformation protein